MPGWCELTPQKSKHFKNLYETQLRATDVDLPSPSLSSPSLSLPAHENSRDDSHPHATSTMSLPTLQTDRWTWGRIQMSPVPELRGSSAILALSMGFMRSSSPSFRSGRRKAEERAFRSRGGSWRAGARIAQDTAPRIHFTWVPTREGMPLPPLPGVLNYFRGGEWRRAGGVATHHPPSPRIVNISLLHRKFFRVWMGTFHFIYLTYIGYWGRGRGYREGSWNWARFVKLGFN